AVAALEQAAGLGAGEQAAVRRRQARDLRELEVAVLEGEALARDLPRLAPVGTPPDARAVPFARRGGVIRVGGRVVNRVVDRPALAERPADLPVAAFTVAFQHEAALTGSDQQD